MSGERGRPAMAGLMVVLCAAITAPAEAGVKPRFTSGGYMQTRAQGKTVALPLAHTAVEAKVAATVASVEVTQRFVNPHRKPIEAIYVFPLPHRAAVYGVTIKIGKRTIEGRVKRRETARRIYQRARARGQTAALLEQERPNIFTQSVANIMPGDRIEVRLRYVEEMLPEHGRYAFTFPMVVGPRYVGAARSKAAVAAAPAGQTAKGWGRDSQRVPDASRITPRLLARGLRPGHDVSIKLRVDPGQGNGQVKHLQVVTHRATVRARGRAVEIELDRRDAIPNKDFVVRYQLAGARPSVALLTHRDRRGGHFLLTIQPQARLKKREIAPREYVFVVDNSGSMSGFPMAQARRIVAKALEALRPSDRFQIIKFAGSPDRFARRSVAATPARVAAGVRYVSMMYGGGGTEFLPALKMALMAPKDPARARIVVFITDGYIGYERQVLAYLRRHGAGSNIFALGVGSSVNRYLIAGMARIGSGHPFYLLNEEKAASVVERLVSTISRPALTAIKVSWGGLDVRQVGPRRIPDLFADKPVYLTGRYRRGGRATVTVRGLLAGRRYVKQVTVQLPGSAGGASNPAVPYLWARQQIASWMDVHDTDSDREAEARRAVTRVALRYNLMSKFTAMVAVDSRVRNRGGTQGKVAVPVPLPQGVSARAAPGRAYGAAQMGVLGVLRGKGRGGGGYGAGTIGLGSLGTIGRGGGGGSGVGYGRGGRRLAARRVRAPRVMMARAVVTGSLDRSIIRRVVRRHVNEVRFLYQRALTRNPKLVGRVVVRIVLSANGKVVAASIASKTLNDPQLEKGLLAAVRRWRFPAVRGGGTVEINYPFVFRPGR